VSSAFVLFTSYEKENKFQITKLKRTLCAREIAEQIKLQKCGRRVNFVVSPCSPLCSQVNKSRPKTKNTNAMIVRA
jgi:hypothetical protein